jgi:hypothetical protein
MTDAHPRSPATWQSVAAAARPADGGRHRVRGRRDFWLLEAATGLTRAEQVLERTRPLDPDERMRLEGWLRRREAREPLQLVLGVAAFHGLEVQVRPGVLVPRPETESLVERVLASLRYVVDPRVHDVGTGSGAIALAIAAARPDAIVSASDVDPTAVMVARANAAALGLPVTVWSSDLLAAPEVAARGGRGPRAGGEPAVPPRQRPRAAAAGGGVRPARGALRRQRRPGGRPTARAPGAAAAAAGGTDVARTRPAQRQAFASDLQATSAGARCASRSTSTVVVGS